MNKRIAIIFLVILSLTINIDTKKISRSRSSGSSRGSSKKTNAQPVPTSLSYPQASAPKPTLFGWQESSARKTQSYPSKQSNPGNTGHSYPSSNTGLSGNNSPKKPTYEENIQRSNAPAQQNVQRPGPQQQTNNQMGHAYPASNGLSGNSAPGSGYPQGSGLSGQGNKPNPNGPQSGANSYPVSNGLSGNSASNTGVGQGSGLPNSHVAPPPYQANNPGNGYHGPVGGSYSNNQYHGAPPPYSHGNNYHPQGPPPPYNYGHNNYGGYGGYGGPGGGPQMPGYFGNSMNYGKGFGGVSRSGSTLAGVGLAGAGIGTVLTGLALWNLARSTGHNHHTVIYDRGQPVGVEPEKSSAPIEPNMADFVNCTLTISSDNATEVIAIPCSIATSFTPDSNVKDVEYNKNANDNTKCIITVVTKSEKEFTTTIPCSVLLNTAAANNVTEAPVGTITDINETTITPQSTEQPTALKLASDRDAYNLQNSKLNCSQEEGTVRDPINACFSVGHNLTVIPLETTVKE